MTATPIPRTLALTVYGDLAVSARSPSRRRAGKPIVTAWVGAERSSEAYRRLRKHLDDGPAGVRRLPADRGVGDARRRGRPRPRPSGCAARELQGYRVGLLHGRLRPAERRELMARFKARDLDVLVATTVIEVGVDVPNATIMIVQEADRFGLAQLHQLRGRVGRGAEQSYCLLVSRPREELTERRAGAAARRSSTRPTASSSPRIDLELRGEGQLLGTQQSGLTDLRFARLTRRPRRCWSGRARRSPALAIDAGPLADEVDALFAEARSAA